jgi:hypothetical protein
MAKLNLDDLIKDLNKADALQKKISDDQNESHRLETRAGRKICESVYECHDPEELAALCDAVGLDNKGYRWGWKDAYDNSYDGNTNYEMQEWSDVLFNTNLELKEHIRKLAKKRVK